MMNLNFIPSSCGDKLLLAVGDYTYYKFQTAVHFVTWRCTFCGCTATALVAMVHVVLREMKLVTCKDEPFLLVNDSVKNIVIFSCQTNLAVLQTIDTIFVDGTFTYCANFFKQLFTVHGIRNGHYMQLCYAL